MRSEREILLSYFRGPFFKKNDMSSSEHFLKNALSRYINLKNPKNFKYFSITY